MGNPLPLTLRSGGLRTAFVSLSLLLFCLCAQPAIAVTGSGSLTVVSEPGFNSMSVTITPQGFSSSSKITTLTGTVDAEVDADPATGATTALTLSGNNLSMSDISFSWLFGIISLQIRNMGGYAYTPLPPAPVTPNSTGGTFAGSLHQLIIDRGTVSGSANVNLANSPIQGAGTGTGTITMVAGTATATHRDFQTTIVIPVDFTDTIQGTLSATVRVQGTLKAAGNIAMPLNDFIAWTDANGLSGASFTAPVAAGAAPLGLAWASGLEPTAPLSAMTPSIEAPTPSITAVLTLPATGTRAPLWIEGSAALTDGSWNPVAASVVSTGVNPLPTGTSGRITIQLGTGRSKFIQVRVDPP